MSDEEQRRAVRAGNLDLAAGLRSAPDQERRIELIKVCAGLGHHEAERWRKELGLAESEASTQPWEALGNASVLAWGCDCISRALEAERAGGRNPAPAIWRALELSREAAAAAGSSSELEQAIESATEEEARLEAEQEADWSRAVNASLSVVVCARSLAEAAFFYAEDAGFQPYVLLGAALRRAQWCAALTAQAVGLSGESKAGGERGGEEQEAAEAAWQIRHLRDAYLWPEVLRGIA